MKKGIGLYWQLFLSTFTLSAFTFGGGYVIVPLMRKKFVDKLGWIDEEEMLNLIALAQSSPGAIAVNTSILIGYRIKGIAGAILTTLGTVMPPLIILTIISFFYSSFRDSTVVSALLKGMQAGVAAVIMDVVFKLASNVVKGKKAISIFTMLIAFIATYVYNINVIYIIIVCGISGAAMVVINKDKNNKKGM